MNLASVVDVSIAILLLCYVAWLVGIIGFLLLDGRRERRNRNDPVIEGRTRRQRHR